MNDGIINPYKYPRARVLLNVHVPLVRFMSITIKERKKYPVYYQKVPDFCFCSLMGHVVEECGYEVHGLGECEWGDWLRWTFSTPGSRQKGGRGCGDRSGGGGGDYGGRGERGAGGRCRGMKSDSKRGGETRLDLALRRRVTQEVYMFRPLTMKVKNIVLFSGEIILAYECECTESSEPLTRYCGGAYIEFDAS